MGAVWLTCLWLFAVGYPLYGMLSGAKPSDPMPRWVGICAAIAAAPKVLIASVLYTAFIMVPLGATKLFKIVGKR